MTSIGSSLGPALEPVLQLLHVLGHFRLCLRTDEERQEELADSVTLEIEPHCHSRTLAVSERLDGASDIPSNGSVDTAKAPARRRVHLGHFVRHGPLRAAHPPSDYDPRAHGGRRVPARGHGTFLPVGDMRRIGEIGEDVLGTPGYLDAIHNRRHQRPPSFRVPIGSFQITPLTRLQSSPSGMTPRLMLAT